MWTKVRVVDSCSDKTCYGTLVVSNVSRLAIQMKIWEIKEKFLKEGFDDWNVEDVFNEFPYDWDWDFERGEYNCVEI